MYTSGDRNRMRLWTGDSGKSSANDVFNEAV